MTACVGSNMEIGGFEPLAEKQELSGQEEKLYDLIQTKLKANEVARLFFLKLHELDLTKLEKKLGEGAVGVVVQLRGSERFGDSPLALKFFEFAESNKFRAADPRGDLIALSFAKKDHLGHTKGVFTFDGKKIHFFENYAPKKHDGHIVIGTLSKAISGETLYDMAKKAPLPLEQVKSLGRQIAKAIFSIHKAGYAHKDIHAENILVESKGHEISIEMIDFGLAGKIDPKRIRTDWRKFGYILGELGGSKLISDPYFFDLLYSENRGLLNGKNPYSESEVLEHPFFK